MRNDIELLPGIWGLSSPSIVLLFADAEIVLCFSKCKYFSYENACISSFCMQAEETENETLLHKQTKDLSGKLDISHTHCSLWSFIPTQVYKDQE